MRKFSACQVLTLIWISFVFLMNHQEYAPEVTVLSQGCPMESSLRNNTESLSLLLLMKILFCPNLFGIVAEKHKIRENFTFTKTESVYTPCESQHKTGSKPGGRAGGGGVAGRARETPAREGSNATEPGASERANGGSRRARAAGASVVSNAAAAGRGSYHIRLHLGHGVTYRQFLIPTLDCG